MSKWFSHLSLTDDYKLCSYCTSFGNKTKKTGEKKTVGGYFEARLGHKWGARPIASNSKVNLYSDYFQREPKTLKGILK